MMLEISDNWTSTCHPAEHTALLCDLLGKVFADDWSAEADQVIIRAAVKWKNMKPRVSVGDSSGRAVGAAGAVAQGDPPVGDGVPIFSRKKSVATAEQRKEYQRQASLCELATTDNETGMSLTFDELSALPRHMRDSIVEGRNIACLENEKRVTELLTRTHGSVTVLDGVATNLEELIERFRFGTDEQEATDGTSAPNKPHHGFYVPAKRPNMTMEEGEDSDGDDGVPRVKGKIPVYRRGSKRYCAAQAKLLSLTTESTVPEAMKEAKRAYQRMRREYATSHQRHPGSAKQKKQVEGDAEPKEPPKVDSEEQTKPKVPRPPAEAPQ
jgi:hypothetical protein